MNILYQNETNITLHTDHTVIIITLFLLVPATFGNSKKINGAIVLTENMCGNTESASQHSEELPICMWYSDNRVM